MNLGIAENPSQRRTRGRHTAGIREVSRMPKDGKNRRSGRDEPRGNDLARDEDYYWIRYLGEGRPSSSSAASAQPPAQTVMRPAARPASLPQPVPRRDPPRPASEPARAGPFG